MSSCFGRLIRLSLLIGTAGCGTAGVTPSSAPEQPGPVEWSGPVRVERGDTAVQTMATTEEMSLSWAEEADTTPTWVDIVRVGLTPEFSNWRVEPAVPLPQPAALRRADQLLAFGLVMETTGDGAADYVVGIDNDAPEGYHVWLTDLATGETEDRIGPPYGDPFDFSHSWEHQAEPGMPPRPPGVTFFPVGFSPPEVFDPDLVRLYAWSSLTEAGEVVAWDYAPDVDWLTAPPREQLGCTPTACPMIGPAPGPGSREWVITVDNASARPAHLFVANDAGSLGTLVGTAVPASVPAGATQRVVFSVPPGDGWAIFVNPTPTTGPLILARDVPSDASGVLPLTINIQPGGSPTISAPGEPGWFGN
jgi:hypothetical protein